MYQSLIPNWIALSFQDRTSSSIEHILFFHDHSIIILILIIIITFYLITSIIISSKFNKFIMEGQEIETIWTILPSFILIFIALPSLKTLYLIEDTKSPSLTIKIIGHQWYWNYEYTSLSGQESERFIEPSSLIRLLKTRDPINLPVSTRIRLLISSADVIHSWTVPSLGRKVDALPGRLNQTFVSSKRLGIYTGQCSEICGINHSFIPIIIKIYSVKEFLNLIKNA